MPKKRFMVAITVHEETYDGDPKGNGAWLTKELPESWSRIKEFRTRQAAENFITKQYKTRKW